MKVSWIILCDSFHKVGVDLYGVVRRNTVKAAKLVLSETPEISIFWDWAKCDLSDSKCQCKLSLTEYSFWTSHKVALY